MESIAWDALTARERDALAAEHVCGWKWYTHPSDQHPDLCYLRAGDPPMPYGVVIDRGLVEHTHQLPHYTTDRNACAEAEAAIYRRGRGAAYAEVLYNMIDADVWDYGHERGDGGVDYTGLFAFITADPDTRCRAMLRAAGVEV